MSARLRIMFVGGSDLHSPDEKQFLAFGQELVARGHEVLLAVRAGAPQYGREETVELPANLSLHAYRLVGRRLRTTDVQVASRFAPSLIHALYPRATVLAASRHWSRVTGAPLMVHLGDDEWGLMAGFDHLSRRERGARLARRAAAVAYPWVWPYSTPGWLRWAARNALAFDTLTPALAEEVQARMGRRCRVVMPAFAFAHGPPSRAAASAPDFGGAPVVLFTGAVGPAHEPDVRLGLRALATVQRRGVAVRFVHAGPIDERRHPVRLAREEGVAAGTAESLGYVPFSELSALLRRASVLIQPGAPTEFNRLRLPSKLQAYLASGTPTVTFAVGFGELLQDRREVLKTYTGDPDELADRLIEALADQELRARLSAGGPQAARRLFDPVTNVSALEDHYREALAGASDARGPSRPAR